MTVIVKRKASETLEGQARKVNIYAVLPAFAWLKGQRLKYVFDITRKLVEAGWMREVAKLIVEECVAESRYMLALLSNHKQC